MTPSVTEEIHRIVRLTQRRILMRTLLTVALGVACVGVVAWRSRTMGWSQPRSTVLVALAALALIAWQGWRSKREWLRSDDTLVKLDTALGLHARLMTAAEFAKQPTPPALYPTLLEETARAMPDVRQQVPKAVDHRSGLLLTALLLLLLWPQRGIWPPPLTPHIPGLTPPTPPTPPETPPSSSQPQSGDQQQRGGQSSGSQDQPQDSSSQGASNRNQNRSSTGSDQSQQKGESRQSREAGHQGKTDSSQQSPSARQKPQDQSSSSQQNKATPPQQGQQQQQQAQSGDASKQQQDASSRNEPSRQGAHAGQQRANAQQQDAQGTDQGTAQGMKSQASADRSEGSKGKGPGQTPGQELTKAQIQQLLKELSGELKTLQEQLQAQQQQMPQPAAGTSTDPNLYDRAEALESAKGKSMPIQLDVDQQASSKARRGGGIGQPSGQIASDGPQQQPEDATLAAQGADETGVDRQHIPPEYRPVFDQLSSNSQ